MYLSDSDTQNSLSARTTFSWRSLEAWASYVHVSARETWIFRDTFDKEQKNRQLKEQNLNFSFQKEPSAAYLSVTLLKILVAIS